jgi:O-antigen/teichoic acid export membrane protein
VLVPLLRFGIMLSLVGLLTQLSLRLDSLVIGLSLGTTDLGYYFVGPQVAAAAAAVPLSLTVIAWPNLMTTYGRSGNEGLLAHLERYIRPIAFVVSPLVTALAVFGIPVLVNGFIPAFAPGLGAMKIFILSVIFVHSVTLLQQVLIATRRVLLLLVLVGLGVAVQAAILIVGSRGGLSLETAAWSAVASQATIALGLLVAAGRLLEIGRADLVRFWLRVPVGWAAAVALILGLDAVAPATHGLVPSLGVGAAQTVAFALLGALVLRFVDRVALRESRALLRGFG